MSAGKMPTLRKRACKKKRHRKNRQAEVSLSQRKLSAPDIHSFIESYPYKAYDPYIRSRIFFLIINGKRNGGETRAAARALGIVRDTVTEALRGIESLLWYINYNYPNTHKDTAITVDLGMSKGG
jgi:hypothetical protein